MKTLYIFIVSMLMLTTAQSFAQNNGISDFTIQSTDFSIDNEPMQVSSTISKTGNTLSWTQSRNNNTLVTELNILQISGNWDNSSSTGSISLTIEISGTTGTLTLVGANNNLSLSILTVNSNDNTSQESVFEVSSIVYL